ncbi:MAG: hypothetical protein Q9163_002595 [Psora crenata]
MSFVHRSLEDVTNAIPDPYDWSVDEVISALCDPSSQLRTAYGSRSFPNEGSLATKLREHDVTGLALLQDVDADCLKTDFNIKSMGQRASLQELIEALQQESAKFQERKLRQTLTCAAKPSVGWAGRDWSSNRERGFGVVEQINNRSQDILQKEAPVPLSEWPTHRTLVSVEGSRSSSPNVKKPGSSISDSKIMPMESKGDAFFSAHPAGEVQVGNCVTQTSNRETTTIDESGRKRRRLAPTPVTEYASSKRGLEVITEEQSPRPLQLQVLDKSTILDESSSMDGAAAVLQSQSNDCQSPAGKMKAPSDIDVKPGQELGDLPTPGVVRIDNQGRKRLMPVHQPATEMNRILYQDISARGREIETDVHRKLPLLPEAMDSSKIRVATCGQKARRSVSTIYLGFESLGVDNLFYGDNELGNLSDDPSTYSVGGQPESDQFLITCPDRYSAAQRRYVHSRMKFYLRSPRIILNSHPEQCIGIVPYPSHVAKKHSPLSMTVFERAKSGDIFVLRSSRANWGLDGPVRKVPAQDDKNTSNVFNIINPTSVTDDVNDIEWKALEKWKYMTGEDQILPLYGESSSEGEYDLDTWKEMEQEPGQLERAEGRSRKWILSEEEVHSLIDNAIEKMREAWKIKMRPRLQPKARRIWTTANRHLSKNARVHRIKEALIGLKNRVGKLRCEIAKEDWSKSSKVSHQCKTLQPSIFDIETLKWEMDVLQLPRAPEKVASFHKQRKTSRYQPEEPTPLKDGEEYIDTDSPSTLGDFITDDDESAGDDMELSNCDEDVTMTETQDRDDGMAFNTLLPWPSTDGSGQSARSVAGKAISSDPHIIDLTQASSEAEAATVLSKAEQAFDIRTPPVNSGSDSDVFSRATRNTKPVFKAPPPLPQGRSLVIELDTTTDDDVATVESMNQKPAHSNVEAIKQMDPTIFLEQQDRKRLLVWLIAHTPTKQRNLAMRTLSGLSMKKVKLQVHQALIGLVGGQLDLRLMDNRRSESILQIAAWFVSWSMVIKYSRSGLAKEHVEGTIDDIDSFPDFYDFLLLCVRPYQKSLSRSTTPILTNPLKPKKQKIIREDSEGKILNAPFRKRVYAVPISQETLDKTQSAMERQMADERRRKDELKLRRAKMQAGSADATEVIVNPGKLIHQEYIRLDHKLTDVAPLKPHQEEGLQFLWREITADPEDLQGCLLAQTMGLGKTVQVIALLVALSQAGQSPEQGVQEQVPPSLRGSHTLILCPPALVENWWDEFLVWVTHPSESIGRLHKISAARKLEDRVAEILTWHRDGGVLIIGYAAFRMLISNNARKAKGGPSVHPPLEEKIHESVKCALLEGPRLVVADEAHEFKNSQSLLSLNMKQIKTRSRIALTGSPLANNLGEYYTLVDWVAPGYLGTPSEFRATYQEDIDAGLYQDSTDCQYRQARKRLKALELVMGPKVHRADVSALHNVLHGKLEFVIKVSLTPLQHQLYSTVLDAISQASARDEPQKPVLWALLHILQLLCNHPKPFRDKLLEIEVKPEAAIRPKRPAKRKDPANHAEESLITSDDDDTIFTEPRFQGDLCRIIAGTKSILNKIAEPIGSLSLSNKMRVLMAIVKHCRGARDKLLIFSHRIPTLDYVADKLRGASIQFERIDGKVDPQKRQAVTKCFNEKAVNICLISTRAGGQGLNLFGANRVVILDDWFNPMWEQQAVGRAYRIGQQKPVYVYRLTTAGTFEQAIQNQTLFKEQLATRVIDKKNPIRSAKRGAGQYLFLPKALEPEDLQELRGKDPLVLDHLLATRESNSILSIVPSETFQVDDGVELTPEERKEVEQLRKDEELRRRNPRHSATVMQKCQPNAMETSITSSATAPHGLPDNRGQSWQPQSNLEPVTLLSSTTSVAIATKHHKDQLSLAEALNHELKEAVTGHRAHADVDGQRLSQGSALVSPVRKTPASPVVSAKSTEVSEERLTPKHTSHQTAGLKGEISAATERKDIKLETQYDILKQVGFLIQPRFTATHPIPDTICWSATKDLQDALSLQKTTSDGIAVTELSKSETCAIEIAALDLVNSETRSSGSSQAVKTGVRNTEPATPSSFSHSSLKRTTDLVGDAVEPSVTVTGCNRATETNGKLIVALDKGYNWKTPPQGKKQDLLYEDEPVPFKFSIEETKDPLKTTEASYETDGSMEDTFN